jgi:phosphoribosylaminoimidazolecarboxamide formyltransferase/IMP cyclohydrolase
MRNKTIKSALISVFNKEGLEPIVNRLSSLGIVLYSTGGTYTFIDQLGLNVTLVEDLTEYPPIFGGRVKTLHPKIFGGILNRRADTKDIAEKEKYNISDIDLVIVDLYPFEETVSSGGSTEEIIEKIDIGGIALIRGAAKNYNDVLIVPSRSYYEKFLDLLDKGEGLTTLDQRKSFALRAFHISSHYDTAIFNYMNRSGELPVHKVSYDQRKSLRYGENPHQAGTFYGDLKSYFDQLGGKDISYNNLIDIEAAVQIIAEFEDELAFGILKHNNACGFAIDSNVKAAYLKAYNTDSTSAFGGVLVCNREIDLSGAQEIHKLFFEIIIAPDYTQEALELLQKKTNRIILVQKMKFERELQSKSLLNGLIVQDYNGITDQESHLKKVTKRKPSQVDIDNLLFASKLCKHSKSNTIVLANNYQLLASGVGQTSRVDALEQAIVKARKFGFDLHGSVMASDAFFPFPDCVEIAGAVGVTAIIQPGGSIKDQLSIDMCDEKNLSMVFSGYRHFKH